ncbi:MAG: DNA polymerase III subunit alpha [Clostridia bacterium]|nr:DNA polymerase III subunit alpha [Clostridia bacterium]
MSFVHLHVHSEYSLLDGACRIEPMLDKIKSMGQTSVAITDHGVMYGAVNFYEAAKKRGLKPIIGCEVYVAPGSRTSKIHGVDSKRYHLILLCKNDIGYKNLIKIVSESWINGFYIKPRVDKQLLSEYHEGLVCLSGCLFGEVSQALLNSDYEDAKRTALWYKKIFGDDYYLEIQNHGLNEQLRINSDLIRLSDDISVPLVATNDAHYINKEDSIIQKILISIQTNHLLSENSGLNFETEEFYLKSENEMLEMFKTRPDAVENTQIIADKCNFDFIFGVTKLPHFDVPEGYDHIEWFNNLCRKGLTEKYGINPPEKCVERMEYELNIINSMGYTDYYLIVRDFIYFAKNHNIPVGPGRGSGAASICAYCIGITGIDPMKYDLLFERFLNPERVSMPDFDIDFCYERREEVINYVISKYGYDHVSQIVTFGTLQAKAAIRDVGRVMGLAYGTVDSIAKLIPNELNITIKKALDESPELRQKYDSDSQIKELIDYSEKIEGMPRHASTHAAGVVITEKPVDNYVPLALNDNSAVTQYTMKGLEKLGLLKMDFLGLRTLTVISYAQKMIRIYNPDFNIDNINLNDKETFKLYSAGKTEGVFQFESAGMKRILTRLNPNSIEDIIAIIALYRPGPMESIPEYLKNKNNPAGIKYKTPELEKILNVTYGCIVYQEQVMQICRIIAGYSLGRADIVRRAISKKQHDVMLKERDNFVNGTTDENGNIICEGAVRRGVQEKTANEIFDEIISFASYAFNKAHAAAYACLSYQTAYLKAHYPKEFFAALMTCFSDNVPKVSEYIEVCKKMGIKIYSPDINVSTTEFAVFNDGIIYCLSAVKNIGRSFISSLETERNNNGKFYSFYNFCDRMYGKDLNRRSLESLIKCGALDRLGSNRRQMIESIDTILSFIDEKKRKNIDGQIGFGDLFSNSNDYVQMPEFTLPEIDDYSDEVKFRQEKEVTGLYLSGHPLSKYSKEKTFIKADSIYDLLEDDIKNSESRKAKFLVNILSVKRKYTKNDSVMAFIEVEDDTSSCEIIAFPQVYEKFKFSLVEGYAIIFNVTVSTDGDSNKNIVLDSVEHLQDITKINEQKADSITKKENSSKIRGLFLRFDNEHSPQIKICANLLSIFNEGSTPVYIYYSSTGKYLNFAKCSINDVLISELKNILGIENVIIK